MNKKHGSESSSNKLAMIEETRKASMGIDGEIYGQGCVKMKICSYFHFQ